MQKDNDFKNELLDLLKNESDPETIKKFYEKIDERGFTKEDNPQSHFCVYFAAYDSEAKKVFIGHHKKSNFWLFNGGHIEKGETVYEALEREIREEWGRDAREFEINKPSLFTITEIDNDKQPCKRHFDIWFFIDVREDDFNISKEIVEEEFYQAGWKSFEEAKNLIEDKNTLLALEYIISFSYE